MAEKRGDQPSLELPSLFKRKTLPVSSPPQRQLPTIGPLPAVSVTGLLVGGLGVALTWVGLQGCAGLRGTSTCGDPGLLVVVTIVAAMAIVGSALLRLLGVPHAASTSVLGTMLVAVLALLVPEGSYERLWMAVALPVAGALAFAAAYGLTSSNTQPGDRPR